MITIDEYEYDKEDFNNDTTEHNKWEDLYNKEDFNNDTTEHNKWEVLHNRWIINTLLIIISKAYSVTDIFLSLIMY